MIQTADFLSEKHPIATGFVGTANGVFLWLLSNLGAINSGLDTLIKILSVISITLTIVILLRRCSRTREERQSEAHRAAHLRETQRHWEADDLDFD